MELSQKKCVPCEGGVPRLGADEVKRLLTQVTGWKVTDDLGKLEKRMRFKDFRAAMAFINRMADVAEAEAHHPDFTVHYNVVDVTLYTHSIGGLHQNDFILAAKIDRLLD